MKKFELTDESNDLKYDYLIERITCLEEEVRELTNLVNEVRNLLEEKPDGLCDGYYWRSTCESYFQEE